MKRRWVLGALAGAGAVGAAGLLARAGGGGAASGQADGEWIMASSDAPVNAAGFEERSAEEWRALSKADWQARLDEAQFYVLRKEGTERSFTSPLNDEKREGWYACAGCGYVLFHSSSKFDSGTGWPSFFDCVEGRLGTKTDFKLVYPRTEYHCARCGGHQGHVFKDGPAPTGLRYCNNGVALVFEPQAAPA